MMPLRSDRLPLAPLLFLAILSLSAPIASAQDEPAVTGDGEAEPVEQRDTVVLLHGLGSSSDVWDEVVPFLAGTYRVFTYEMPGHGETATIPSPVLDEVTTHFASFLDLYDIENPYLVGHAMGGMVALRYAFAHPGDIRRVLVLDTAPKQLATQEEKEAVTRQLMDDYDRFVAGRFLNMSRIPDVTDRIVDQALRTDSATLVTLLMSSFDFDLSEELPRQAVPILVVGSELFFPDPDHAHDTLYAMGYDNARTIAFKRLDGCGHYAMLEMPTYLASIILAYFSDVHGH